MSIGPGRQTRGRYAQTDAQTAAQTAAQPGVAAARSRVLVAPTDRSRRLAAGALLATLAVGMLTGPLVARAADAQLQVDQEGWAAKNNAPITEVNNDNPLGVVVPQQAGEVIVAQPNVDAGTLPVALRAGTPNYLSLLQVDTSLLPTEIDINSFTVALHAVGRADFGTPTGIEMCGVVDFWAGAPNMQMSELPAVDCVFNAIGVQDATDSSLWTFDLAGIALSWVDGSFFNNGVMLRPFEPENLQTGQAAPGQDFQISFAGAAYANEALRPAITVSYEDAPAPAPFVPVPAQTTPPSASGGDFYVPPPVFETVDSIPQVAPEFAPEVAPPVNAPVAVGAPLAVPAGNAWYAWMLVPIFAAGLYSVSRGVTWDPVPLSEVVRDGATTRLIGRRRADLVAVKPSFQV